MKFNRKRLIAVVEREIQRREAEHTEVLAKVTEEYEAQQAEWLKSHHPQELKAAAQAIVRKIGRGKPITNEDVEAFGVRGETHVFSRNKPEQDYRVTRNGKPKTEALESLLAILVAAEDEYVTASALRDLGYRNLAPLLRDSVNVT